MRKGVKSYAPELTIWGVKVCLFSLLCWLCVLVHIYAVIGDFKNRHQTCI